MIMNRALHKFVFSVLFTLLLNASYSQTLYWVGGTGNFSDPKHWSKTSGGSPAFLIPDNTTDVFFDDRSGDGRYTVNFAKNSSVKSFNANSTSNNVSFEGTKQDVVYISEGIYLGYTVRFNSEAEMIFSSASLSTNLIEFGISKLRCNLYFNHGNYTFRPVVMEEQNTINFGDGKYTFYKSAVSTGNFISTSPNATFNFDQTVIKSSNFFRIDENSTVNSNKLYLSANKNSAEKFKAPLAMMNQQSNTFVSFAPICSLTITTVPSCNGPCTGVMTISFSPGCVDNPYSVSASNGDASCAATTASLSGVFNTATSSVVSFTGACVCPQNYLILILDNLGNPFIQNVNFNVNTATATNINTLTSCSYLCDGIMAGNIFGSFPYTVAVTPNTVTPANFTTNIQYTLTNLCSGQVYTLTVTDKDGCVANITKTMGITTPINANANVQNVLCNAACNGSITVSPTGGSPGYTVVFSPTITPSSFTVAAAGSASVGGICPGAYSSTITDTKGCTLTTNYNITQPPAMTVTPTQTNLVCNAVCNGVAQVSVSGGTSPYFYSWSPSASTASNATGLCAGTQTVSILDNNACPRTQTFNITSPPAITVTTIDRDVSCNSLCNGSATVSVAGGVAPYTFTWNPATTSVVTSPSSTASSLCPNTYTIITRDNNLCTNTVNVVITQPPALTITATKTDNTCFNSCAGSATVVVSGGNGGPFTYTWSPVVTPSVVTGATVTGANMCAGTFTLSARDVSLCPTSTVITIVQPASITPNVTTGSLNCNGVCIGSINSVPAGGSGGPYTFTLFTPVPSSIVGPPPYTNLCAGLYTLAISDVSNCVSNTTINIAQPTALVPSIAGSSVTCFNACNGSLAGSILGGTPGYTLSWATPTGTVAGGNIINQCAGNYTFFVIDSKSCTAQQTFTLLQPSQITTTFNIINPSCPNPPGGCNGQISTIVGGGTPGYTLNWSNSGGNPNINLCAGVYTLTVNDANNCIRQFTAGVVAPPAFTVAVTTMSTVCAGDCNGSVTVTASGGTGTLSYQFSTVPATTVTINTTGILTGLCAGAYIVQITDANGCSTSQVFNINAPPLLTAAITGVMNTCNICTGAATVTVNGGVPGYTINWTNSVPAVVGTGSTASALCLGNYTATVTDANGCVRTATVGIANTVTVNVVTSGSSILCNGACNATAQANPSGGTPPYSYTWTTAPTQTTQIATGLCAGNYTVTVVDNIGCSNSGTISFTQPASITVTSSQTNIPCFGGCTGVITTTVSGGVSPYTYSWSPGGQTTTSLSALCIGGYSVRVTDFNNCTVTVNYSITTNPSLTASFTSTSPTGCNISNGVMSATASGGNGGPYTFQWIPATTSVVVSPMTTASNLGAGTYSVIVTDGVGCTNTVGAVLSNPAGPTVTVLSSTITCFGGANGSATASAVGTGPFSFTWSPATASVVAGATTTASGMVTGTYNINVTDIATGCITSQTLNIVQPTQMTITSNVVNATCSGTPNGSITATVSGGTPNYTLNWLPAGTGTAITNLGPGNYTVNVNDANGCIMTRTFAVTAPGALTVTSTQTNVSCNSGSNAAISLTVSGGTPGYNFNWTPIGPFPGSAANSVSGLIANIYTVNITDNNGCPTVATFTITQPTAIVQNVITTNAVCNSSCTGTASQVVSGGTPTYSFSWSSVAATTQSVGSLCAGNYTATIIDGNGCISNSTFAITQPSAISITATPTHPKCNAACDGSITTNIAGGNPGYAYSWSPVGAGPNPTGLCAGTYTLVITDASLCPGTAVITLTNPPLLLSNITFTNPLCNANCNGIAVSTPSNAVGVVSFTWLPTAQTTSMATGLCAGIHTVLIQDANGCTDMGSVTLSNPPVLNVNISIAAATCGSANAQVTVTPAGGTPTYNFVWTPAVAGNTNVAQNIAAGVYTVSVTDNNGCNNTLSFPVSNSGGATLAAISITSVNCNNQCTGGATITSASGGTSPYVFTWVAPPSANSVNPQSNLCAGTYTAVITDSNNCIYFQGVTINEPPPIDDNEAITSAFCIGVCSGSIVLTPAGGTGPYTYAWSPSASTNSFATSLCVGVHTATITDNLGCAFSATYNVPGTTILTSAIATTSNLCFGNCNGSATVTATGGGLAPFSYSWSNAQSGLIANNLCMGTYSVIITDNNGCQNTFTADIAQPNAISVLPSVTSPSCGMCNGSATVVTGGGTLPFTYSWTSSATNTTSSESNLCAGLYQVQVTDANGCMQTQNIPISSSTTMTEVYSVQNELCAGSCNGQVTVTPIGGTSPYTYFWLAPPSTSSIVTNLCGGTYFVQITDAQGCTLTSSVSVNSATTIAVNPSVQQPTCGANTGTITVSPTGGSGSYTVTWLPAGSGTVITGGAGIYTVSVFDGNCTQTTAINMNNSTAPALFFNVTNNGCSSGPCIGSVVVTPTLGTAPYDFNWSTSASANNVASHSVTGLCASVITLTVTDAAGCMAFQSFTITQNPLLNLSLPVVTPVACNGDCNGAIQLVPSGGALPYSISWIPASTVTPSNPNTNLCAGSYTGVVTDANGCILTRTVDIIDPAAYTFSAQVTDATCNSAADGAISTTVSGATPGYTYTWTDASSNTYTTSSLTNVLPGTYTLSIVDSQGCLRNDTLTINGSFTVVANAGTDMTLCVTPNAINLDGSASINGQTYNWTQLAPTNTIANTVSTSVIPAIGTNTYVLLATSSVAVCFDDDTVLVIVNPLPDVNAGPTQTVSLYATANLGGSPTSISGTSFTWSPVTGLDNPNSANPITSTTINTTYTVFVTDANGCVSSSTVDIFLYPDVIIPNGFSPNSDGRNDTWIIDNIQQFTECTVEIYNRWGELLFQSPAGYPKPWDGIYHGKPLPVGTYYYIINFNHVAYPKPFTGPLTIFR